MNRLTKKDYKKWVQDNGYYTKKNAQRLTKIQHKLGKLEDIEEEIGCPLDIFMDITLGKITEIIVNYSDAAGYDSLYEELTIAYVSGIIESYEYPGCLCIETNLCDVPIKDYKKTWWLKGDKI